MKKVLIVRAHPLTQNESRSMRVTDAFVEAYKQHNSEDEIEDINLYKIDIPEIDEDILNGWSALGSGTDFNSLSDAQQKKIALFNSFTEKFLEKDKIIIANPLWNLSVPTRLKAWFDTITVSGKTFAYTEKGAEGLVKGKKVLHIQANGGVYGGADPGSQYVKTLLNFLGVKDFHELFVEGMDHTPDKAEEIVADAIEKAKRLAKEF